MTESRKIPISDEPIRSCGCAVTDESSGREIRNIARGDYRVPPRDDSVPAPKPGGMVYRFIKRVFDIVFSSCIVIVGFIPGVILCTAIVLDSPGAPIYRQKRIGKGGREIGIYKFRTMVADAHECPERYLTPEQLETWKREQKLDDDPRVTRIGKVLRRTSLDEIPQFLNALKGELSVIGPRPVTLEETYEFGDGRDEFLSVKPGITGWWQVTARNGAVWADGSRQDIELFYVRHASLALDARVFWKTFKAMGRGR